MLIFSFSRKISDYLSLFLVHVAMWGIFAMMLLVVIDILMRTFANRSTLISEEVGGYLLVLIAYLAMAETFKQGRHIRVDIIVKRLPDRLRSWLEAGLLFIGLVSVIVVVWRVIIMVYRSYTGNVTTPGVLLTPVYLPQTLIIIGLAALGLQCIMGLFGTLHGLWQSSKETSAKINQKASQK